MLNLIAKKSIWLINQLELPTFELNKTNSIQTKSLLENDNLLLKINTLEKQEINSFGYQQFGIFISLLITT